MLIQVNTVMLSTWFASNLLIVHGKKTEVMILGNPFQEPVLHIGDIIFPSNSHDSRHSLQSQAFNKK